MHNCASVVEGCGYCACGTWNHAINNCGLDAAWRKLGNGTTSISNIDLTAVHPFVGLGNYPVPATHTLTWGDVVVTGTAIPKGESTDSVAVGKDTYTTGEIVYATGGGLPPSANVDVYIVGDLAWTDGMAIPLDVSSDGMDTVPTDAAGSLGPANVWPPPLTPGEYDMVFDANQNGTYNAGIDVVDHPDHPGFVVPVPKPVGGIIVPVSKVELLAPWVGLAALMAMAIVAVAIRRRRA